MAPESSFGPITPLRERIALFKEQSRRLLDRFEKREISQVEARAEAERLERELREAERQVDKWVAESRRTS